MVKTAGRITAMALVTGVVGVVLYSALKARPAAPASPSSAARDFGPPPATRSTSAGGTGSPQDLVALAEEGVWTRVDPATGRLRFRMTWKRLDPRDAGEFVIDRPCMWMAESGRTIRVEAPSARLVWPSRDREPESGELVGGVRVSLAAREGVDDAALKDARELGALRSQTLAFQQSTREISTSDRVEVEAPGVRAVGVGLTLRLGEGPATISVLRLEREGRIEYRADEDPAGEDASPVAAAARGTPNATNDETVLYSATFVGDVRLESGPRRVSSDALTLIARTFGGRLRDGAIADFNRAVASTANRAERPAPENPGAPSASVLTWTGPLEVRALREAPAELAKDDVAVRFDGETRGVEFADADSRSRIRASSATYLATSRRATLFGGDRGVRAQVADVADIRAGDLDVDLTTGEGVARGAGEGWLVGRAAGFDAQALETGPRRRGAKWGERVAFTFDTSRGPVGADEPAVKQVRFIGGAALVDGEAGLAAEELLAVFDRYERGSTIRRLAASGMARAHDNRGGCVSGEQIDFAFTTDEGGESVPTVATIRRGALAEREGESLGADLIEAGLARSADGDIEIATVEARGGVRAAIARSGQVGALTANADTLRADAGLRAVDLIGTPVLIEQRSHDASGELRGSTMRVEGAAESQRLTVFGAGSAKYAMTSRNADAKPVEIEVGWTGGLVYDDTRGRAEVEGEAEVSVAAGDDERHVGRGTRIMVDLTPKAPSGAESAERTVERAIIEGDAQAAAEVELRRYAPGAAARGEATLEGLAFLRGPSIEMSGGAARLSVQGAGLLLLEDRRPEEAAAEPRVEFDGVRGTTLFSWEGSMVMDRATGSGVMTGNVLIRHKDPASGRMAEVACQEARVWVSEGAENAATNQVILKRAEASGGIAARYPGLQLNGSRLEYDAATGRLIAIAEPGSTVSVYEEATGRSVSGEAASLELSTGAYRIEKMEALSLPR